MTDKETMPEELWVFGSPRSIGDLGFTNDCKQDENDVPYLRHDTAISKKTLIELLKGKRMKDQPITSYRAVDTHNALIDELIKEIE